MSTAVLFLTASLGGFSLSAAGFWWAYVRPDRSRRRRFFDLAFGHDGSDGLPEAKDIFTRLASIEGAALLNGKGDQLVKDVTWMRRTLTQHIADAGAHK